MSRGLLQAIRCGGLLLCLGTCCFAGYPGAGDPQTRALLEKTGSLVDLFWKDMSSFNCTETVIQEKLGRKGKREYRQDSVFDYLAIARTEKEDLTIEELRIPRKEAAGKPIKPALLSTNGFPTLLLVFHPLQQPNYKFWVESEKSDGEWRVGFEHIVGTRSTAALMIRDRIYPLDFRGTALIDRESGAIIAITANLMAPMKSINIEDFRIETEYAPRNFASELPARWLPSKAVIELRTALQHWRNTHFYDQYKRFSVQATEKISR